MTLVAIETSTAQPSIAVWHAGRSMQTWLEGARSHASDLLPMLSSLLKACGQSPSDIERVVVGRGPGSYTGLRVGAATALGVARGSEAKLGGISSFEALAWRALKPGEECVVLVDARADEIYWAHLRRDENDVTSIVEPRVVRSIDLAVELPNSIPIFGQRGIEQSARLSPEQAARVRHDSTPQAGALIELALARGDAISSEIEPLYLRAFAVRSRRA